MSMTKNEFKRRYRELRDELHVAPLDRDVAALAEEAGMEWAPEPTPEPTGDDLSTVRVIDAAGNTWLPGIRCWIRLVEDSVEYWPEVPQPVTVLRPEGGAS